MKAIIMLIFFKNLENKQQTNNRITGLIDKEEI